MATLGGSEREKSWLSDQGIHLKGGVEGINSDLATLIRTVIVLITLSMILFATGQFSQPGEISAKSWLFLILSGQVAVHRGAQTFATLAGGEFFGEMSLVEPAPRSASVTAMSATFLFRLPHDALRKLISDDAASASAILVQVVKTLSERLRRANQMLSSVDLLADWLAGSMV